MNKHAQDILCANIQAKQTTWALQFKFDQKMELRLEIQKTNVGVIISILEILCVSIFRQNKQL